jgi:hypothetical protein
MLKIDDIIHIHFNHCALWKSNVSKHHFIKKSGLFVKLRTSKDNKERDHLYFSY